MKWEIKWCLARFGHIACVRYITESKTAWIKTEERNIIYIWDVPYELYLNGIKAFFIFKEWALHNTSLWTWSGHHSVAVWSQPFYYQINCHSDVIVLKNKTMTCICFYHSNNMINIVREGLTGPLLDVETTSPSGRPPHNCCSFCRPTGTIFGQEHNVTVRPMFAELRQFSDPVLHTDIWILKPFSHQPHLQGSIFTKILNSNIHLSGRTLLKTKEEHWGKIILLARCSIIT